jgi:TolB-like protein/class 3 adenylate cyclase/Tfp pilus assembly protein PilF
LSTQDTSAGPTPDLQLQIAHLLLIDVVGYSKLLVNEQIELLQELNQLVRSTECFRAAETGGKLIRLPTGDGMALLFFHSPEEPARCALEISRSLQDHPHIRVRMGVHSGPVNQTTDVNDRSNVAGAGINVAQRVMDCADAGHILVSKHLADDLAHYRHWQPYLHDLGECEVKHGLRLHVVNLYKEGLGNPAVPEKLKRGRRWKHAGSGVHPISASRWPKFVLIVALLLSAVALAVSFSIFFRRISTAPKQGPVESSLVASIPVKSIAVLPFENLSDDRQNAYFADGVQDEILTDLAKVADLKVISRTSVMQYKTEVARNLREIAAALGVAHILEGSVQRVAGRVRVSAQLIDARTDAHIWADHYERDLADVFAIQSEIAEAIVARLKAKLSPEEKTAIEQRSTTDLAAHELYIRAKDLMTRAVKVRAEQNLLDAALLLNEAVTRDPTFFLGYYLLASVHDQIYLGDVDRTPARLALADAAIKAALKLRPDSGEAHLAVAEHLYCGYLDYNRARQEIEIARRTLPNEPRVFELAGYIDRRQSRWDESMANLRRALELDPRNFYILQQLARSYDLLRDFRNEAAILDRALTIAPNDAGARLQRAVIELAWHADTRPMHSTIEATVAQNPDAARGLANTWLDLAFCERDSVGLARALAVMPPEGYGNEGFFFPRAWCVAEVAQARGDHTAARDAFTAARITAAAMVDEQPTYGPALCVLALIDAGLGRKEEAIQEGRRAVELLPVTKDAINGALLIEYLAMIYARCGEKDRAIEQLVLVTSIPSDVNYGRLMLHPQWDSMRGDPRFEKIVASLAPK